MITSAPYARSSEIFSWLILSGITKMQRYPRIAAAIASPCPVLPDVGSTIVPPGRSVPDRSAASIMRMPMRSFTDPPGFSISTLASIVGRSPRVTDRRRTRGVSPIASRNVSSTRIEPTPLAQ